MFELNKTSLVYSGLILFSFRITWACIRSVYTTFINVYYFYVVKMQELFAIAVSFGFFVRNRGFPHFSNPKPEKAQKAQKPPTDEKENKQRENAFHATTKERKAARR